MLKANAAGRGVLVALMLAPCLLALGSCNEVVEDRVLHRSNCLVCHRPLDENGKPNGIEEAHAGVGLSCVDCHGGNAYVCDGGDITYPTDGGDPLCSGAWVYDMDRAHVSPGDGPRYIKNLLGADLDNIGRAFDGDSWRCPHKSVVARGDALSRAGLRA